MIIRTDRFPSFPFKEAESGLLGRRLRLEGRREPGGNVSSKSPTSRGGHDITLAR